MEGVTVSIDQHDEGDLEVWYKSYITSFKLNVKRTTVKLILKKIHRDLVFFDSHKYRSNSSSMQLIVQIWKNLMFLHHDSIRLSATQPILQVYGGIGTPKTTLWMRHVCNTIFHGSLLIDNQPEKLFGRPCHAWI